jgi:hypothetical protein
MMETSSPNICLSLAIARGWQIDQNPIPSRPYRKPNPVHKRKDNVRASRINIDQKKLSYFTMKIKMLQQSLVKVKWRFTLPNSTYINMNLGETLFIQNQYHNRVLLKTNQVTEIVGQRLVLTK